MTALAWDRISERVYQTGIDRGVLYLQDGSAIPWNGLIGVDESTVQELKSFYIDGVKYLQNLTPGEFQGKLKAFTYPDEFDSVNGIVTPASGLSYHEQPSKSFNLSYRTRIGNDVDGINHGYKIHILYNLMAIPDEKSFDTLGDSSVSPIEFGWSLTGTPEKPNNLRPTVHVSIDSTKTPSEILRLLENTLYGTDSIEPSLPTISEIGQIFGFLGALVIIDNGDGTWTAIDESDTYISMTDPTTFEIAGADVVIVDANTYQISSTNYD